MLWPESSINGTTIIIPQYHALTFTSRKFYFRQTFRQLCSCLHQWQRNKITEWKAFLYIQQQLDSSWQLGRVLSSWQLTPINAQHAMYTPTLVVSLAARLCVHYLGVCDHTEHPGKKPTSMRWEKPKASVDITQSMWQDTSFLQENQTQHTDKHIIFSTCKGSKKVSLGSETSILFWQRSILSVQSIRCFTNISWFH